MAFSGTLVAAEKTGFPAIPGIAVTREINAMALFGRAKQGFLGRFLRLEHVLRALGARAGYLRRCSVIVD